MNDDFDKIVNNISASIISNISYNSTPFTPITTNKEEEQFIRSLVEQSLINNLPPKFKFVRLSNGIFNVDYEPICYVGKIGLRSSTPISDKYAVKRIGTKRALRLFESKEEAIIYKNQKNADEIEFRPGLKGSFYIHYFVNDPFDLRELYTSCLKECIDIIPYWIKYIKMVIERRRNFLFP